MGDVVVSDDKNLEIKRLIIRYNNAKGQRDALLDSIDMPNLDGGINMSVVTGMISKTDDFKKAFQLTKQMELISAEIIGEVIGRVNHAEQW